MSFLRAHKIGVGIFVLALLARLVYFGLSFHTYGGGDLISAVQGADGYFRVAQNIVEGHGFSGSAVSPYEPYSFRPPLFHYFLAGGYFLFGGWGGAVALQILVGSLLPLLAMYVVRHIFSNKIAIVTGVILALEPFSILFSVFFYSESLFMLLLFLSLLYLFKYLREKQLLYLVFSACFIGFAALTRPTVQYLPLVIAAILLFEWQSKTPWRARAGRAVLFLAVFVAVLSPWLMRNYVMFGEAALSPQLGVNLYANVVPSVLAIENGTNYQIEFDKLAAQGVKGPNETKLGEADGYTQAAVKILLQHPTAFALLSANTLLAFFTHDGMFEVIKHLGLRPDVTIGKPALFLLISEPAKFVEFLGYYVTKPAVVILIMRVVWSLITLLFFVGAWRYFRREGATPYAVAALCVVAYFALITLVLGLTVNARYRLPVEFIIIPFALYGFLYLKELWNRSR